jgi:hypothetical protein
MITAKTRMLVTRNIPSISHPQIRRIESLECLILEVRIDEDATQLVLARSGTDDDHPPTIRPSATTL